MSTEIAVSAQVTLSRVTASPEARVATEQTDSATAAPEGVDGHLLVFSTLQARRPNNATHLLGTSLPVSVPPFGLVDQIIQYVLICT